MAAFHRVFVTYLTLILCRADILFQYDMINTLDRNDWTVKSGDWFIGAYANCPDYGSDSTPRCLCSVYNHDNKIITRRIELSQPQSIKGYTNLKFSYQISSDGSCRIEFSTDATGTNWIVIKQIDDAQDVSGTFSDPSPDDSVYGVRIAVQANTKWKYCAVNMFKLEGDPITTPQSTIKPTPKPTVNPTHKPTFTPTPNVTPNPTSKPTFKPTTSTTPNPTTTPTSQTPQPTAKPTSKPSFNPITSTTPKSTANPTLKPTSKPLQLPTKTPTKAVGIQSTLSPVSTHPTTTQPTLHNGDTTFLTVDFVASVMTTHEIYIKQDLQGQDTHQIINDFQHFSFTFEWFTSPAGIISIVVACLLLICCIVFVTCCACKRVRKSKKDVRRLSQIMGDDQLNVAACEGNEAMEMVISEIRNHVLREAQETRTDPQDDADALLMESPQDTDMVIIPQAVQCIQEADSDDDVLFEGNLTIGCPPSPRCVVEENDKDETPAPPMPPKEGVLCTGDGSIRGRDNTDYNAAPPPLPPAQSGMSTLQ